MPGKKEWRRLARETFSSFEAGDLRRLWEEEWRPAGESLTEPHRRWIDAEPKKWKRAFREVDAVLFGLTARLAPARRRVFAAVLVLVLLAVLSWVGDQEYGAHPGTVLPLVLGVLFLMALLGMELVDKLRFRDELVLARELQAELVPQVLPDVPGFELAAWGRVSNTVGGDLYEFQPLPEGRLAVLFGDASGHGMAAGLVMAVAHTAWRSQVDFDSSPAAVTTAINRLLCRTGACRKPGSGRSFFAGIALRIGQDGSFSAVVAGHPPILHVDSAGRVARRIGRGCYPLGIRERWTCDVDAGQLEPGESLVFISDGLPEARDASGTEFGDGRVAGILLRRAGAPAAEIVASLASELLGFLGRRPVEDDVSIAIIQRNQRSFGVEEEGRPSPLELHQ